jgi:hypothetical protein
VNFEYILGFYRGRGLNTGLGRMAAVDRAVRLSGADRSQITAQLINAFTIDRKVLTNGLTIDRSALTDGLTIDRSVLTNGLVVDRCVLTIDCTFVGGREAAAEDV